MCVSLSGFLFGGSERNEKRKKIVAYTVEKHEKTFLTQKNKKSEISSSLFVVEVEEFVERERAERTKKTDRI